MADDSTATPADQPSEDAQVTVEPPKSTDDVPPEVKAALRKANKEAETLRLRLKEFEDRDKSEAEKVADRLAAAEERAAVAERRAIRFEIASEFSLSADDAKALEHVASEDGMREVAALLAAKADQRKKQGNHVPREGNPTPGVPHTDEREFVRNLFGSAD